jgi:tetratricopeptide (TPR) repeat protein
LVSAQLQSGDNAAALATVKRIPPQVRAQLARDPEYLRTLSAVYLASGQDDDAERVLEQALNLPFPDNGRNMRAEMQLQYAALLSQSGRSSQAQALYLQILSLNPNSIDAWQGLISAYHAMNADAQALTTVERMPPSVYESALRDPGFLAELAAINQSQNRLEIAQQLLERAIALETSTGGAANVPTQLQLAGIYLRENNPARAYTVYRSVLTANPERLDAWRGLLQTLHATGHDREVIAQVQQIPAATRQKLNADGEYLTIMASVYASLGDNRLALATLQQVESRYRADHQVVPANVEIQHTWLLYNQGDEVGLYANLMDLGARGDLTDEQRATVQTLWTTWSVRRAQQAADAGNLRLSMNILNAAARSFPDNPEVTMALAVGYLTGGDAKTAVKLYKKVDLANAKAGDYQAAIGAALAANDRKQTELWLRGALQLYPQDPKILTLAAKFEQARGNNGRAKEYYQAALAAMPAQTSGETLQQTLRRPGPTILRPQPKPPQDDDQDLGTLLAPNASNTSRLAPQPRYLPGGTGDGGGAPVILNPSPAVARTRQPVPYITGAMQPQAPLVQQRLQQEMMTLPPTPAPVVRQYQQAPAVEYQQPAAQYQPGQAYAPSTEQRYVIPSQTAHPHGSAATKTTHKAATQSARSRAPQPNQGVTSAPEERYVVPQNSAPPAPAPTYAQQPLAPQYQPVVPQAAAPQSRATPAQQRAQQPTRQTRPAESTPLPNVQYTQPVQQPTYIQPGNSAPQVAPDQQPVYTDQQPNVQLTQPLPQPTPETQAQPPSSTQPEPDSTDVDQSTPKADTKRKRQNQRQRIGDYVPPAGSAVVWHSRRDIRAAWFALMQDGLYHVNRRATLVFASYSDHAGVDYPAPSRRRAGRSHAKSHARSVKLSRSKRNAHHRDALMRHGRTAKNKAAPASHPAAHEPRITTETQEARYVIPGDQPAQIATTTTADTAIGTATMLPIEEPLPQLRYAPLQRSGSSRPYLLRNVSYSLDGQSGSSPTTFQGQSNPPANSKSQNCTVRQVTDCTPAKKPTVHHRRKRSTAAAPAYSEPAAEPVPQYAPAATGPTYYGGQTATSGPDQPPPPGVTDQQLKNRNLPPLRGVDDRSQKQADQAQISTREEDERALAMIEGGYSGWTGGTAYLSHRSGDSGFTKLNAYESPFEASAPIGTAARVTLVVRPALLDSGTPNPNNLSGPGGTPLLLGSFLPGNSPAFLPQQNAAGVGGDVEFTTSTFGISGGYTPFGFLVSNFTGALRYRPGGGGFTISALRDSVKDTQLSYSGLRDPHSARPGFNGNIWGGVIATGGSLQYSKGTELSGFHVNLGGQVLTGVHVQDNQRIDGDAGAYFRVLSDPVNGDMTIGANLFGMHYQHNLRFFTYGQGGYFSPESFVLLSAPITYQGHRGLNFHYTVLASVGVQAFQEDSSPFYPLDPTLQAAAQSATYPSQSVVGANYDVQARAAYRVADHWYIGGFAQLSNSRDYNQQQAGFFIRFLFRPQYPSDDGATGLFPTTGLRPLLVP